MITKGRCSIERKGSDIEYYTVTCGVCGTEFTFEAHQQPGFSDSEDVICPNCNENLGEVRADLGIFSIKIIKKGKKINKS